MKLKHYFSGALLMALMASCSNDLPEAPGQILENETTTYIRLSLVGQGSSTRADDFEKGTEEESDVKEILLTFFDAGRNYVGTAPVTVDENTLINDKGPGDYDNSVERILTVVATVDLPQNINYPKYVVAYVNPTTSKGDLSTEKLEDAMCFIRQRESVSCLQDTKSKAYYRTMNNSVYFDNTTGYSRFATEVDFKKCFFDSFEAAKNAKDDEIITITVERMEAKVRLENLPASNKISSVIAGADKEYSLTFVPEYWFVNATEKRSFLLKNYRTARKNYIYEKDVDPTINQHMPSADNEDWGFRLSALNSVFTDAGHAIGFSVNDYTNKRSYWAIDPTYFFEGQTGGKDFYPDVSYDVKYGNVNTAAPAKYYPLEYRSYEDVMNEYTWDHVGEPKSYVTFDNGKKIHEYVLENTMSTNTLRGTDAKAAMTSVVLLGYYKVTKNGESVFDGSNPEDAKDGKAFYVRHENNNKYVMVGDNEAIEFFLERNGSTFYVVKRDKDGNEVKDANGKTQYELIRAAHLDPNSDKNENHVNYGISHADFVLEYPKSDYTQGKKLSEQWRTLRVKKTGSTYNENIYVYDGASNTYKQLQSLSDTELGELYKKEYSTFGVIERFEHGRAYFNVPLKHIWADLTSTSNEFKPDEVKIGQYGVVRNHVYDLKINGISGLGTGIGDLKQPIVVPTENELYYISTRLNILKWKVVSQSVDLK